MDKITVNDVEYAPVKANGKRAVIVVDRGWIFAGDVTRENGRIHLSRALWVFRWEKIGFNGVIATPEKADIRPIDDVDMPEGAEIFCVPVVDTWGL
jgi:hypothetical protein